MSSATEPKVLSDMARSVQGTQKREETLEPCMCFPLSTLCLTPQHSLQARLDGQDTLFLSDECLVQTTPQLNFALRTRLKELFPRTGPLSLLLLHVSQLDQPALTSSTEPVRQRGRYHVTQNVLMQVLNSMQRAIRHHDQLLLEEGVGAAMLFPSVDEQGIQNIIERVYSSICLLQAETIVPPLVRVTDIVLGYGTSQPQNTSHLDTEQMIEALLASAGRVVHRLVLRPALSHSLWGTMPSVEPLAAFSASQLPDSDQAQATAQPVLDDDDNTEYVPDSSDEQRSPMLNNLSNLPNLPPYVPPTIHRQSARRKALPVVTDTVHQTPASATMADASSASPIPFLRLPTSLSPRLKHLIPYDIAQQLQCAPVGRDHHRLTVAMADPTDHGAIQRLKEVTGMTIFPVSCEVDALLMLLTERW